MECFRSSILVRPSRLLHRTGDYIEGEDEEEEEEEVLSITNDRR